MKTILLAKLLELASEQCTLNKAEFINIGFSKDKPNDGIAVCQRDNGQVLIFHMIGLYEGFDMMKLKGKK